MQPEQPRLVFFFSPRSGSSRKAEAFLAQVLQRRANHNTFRLLRIDADKRPELAERLEVTVVPTLLVVAGGRIRARLAEPAGSRQIRSVLAPWLK